MVTISILIPTYNEEMNVVPLHKAIVEEFQNHMPNHDYEIVFIDNHSTDDTRKRLLDLCQIDVKVKTIFNAKNFGQFNSPFYGLMQTSGDCTVLMCADFQDPVEMIHQFVDEWERGYRIVIGVKTSSDENKLMRFLRSCYYKTIKKLADIEQIEHFTGFGLYDRSFIDVLRKLDDPSPYLRGIVAELGFERKEMPYKQAKRLHGKTSNDLYKLYDASMLGITSYTKIVLRMATFCGFTISAISFTIAIIYLVMKLIFWNDFPMGTAPILIGMFFMGALQLFFIGFLGEYILSINTRVMGRPLVVEERRINFD